MDDGGVFLRGFGGKRVEPEALLGDTAAARLYRIVAQHHVVSTTVLAQRSRLGSQAVRNALVPLARLCRIHRLGGRLFVATKDFLHGQIAAAGGAADASSEVRLMKRILFLRETGLDGLLAEIRTRGAVPLPEAVRMLRNQGHSRRTAYEWLVEASDLGIVNRDKTAAIHVLRLAVKPGGSG